METMEFVEDVAIIKDCLGQLSILSESLQESCTTLLKASDYLYWTVNALVKIKESVEAKYQFTNVCDSSEVDFKGVELNSFQSRNGYRSFDRKQFLQGLIDNLQRRLIDSSEKVLLDQVESLCLQKMAKRGKSSLVQGQGKFHVTLQEI